MAKRKDLTGLKFNRLTALYPDGNDNHGNIYWVCQCDCGNSVKVIARQLITGGTKSCGCLKREVTSKRRSVDLIGKRFGRLVVAEKIGSKNGCIYWRCLCDCGNTVITKTSYLNNGDTKSCGCLQKDRVHQHNAELSTHNQTGTRLYGVWTGIKTRCLNPYVKSFAAYGGRGITICNEWLGEHGFENFSRWATENGYDKNAEYSECTIDRIDVNGNYEPSNCRWANAKTQSQNRRNVKLYTFNGESHTVPEWVEITGEKYQTVRWRLQNNKSPYGTKVKV